MVYQIKEQHLQQAVIDLAELNGWLWFHDFDSRKNQPGFPDLVLVRPPHVIWVELKSERGRPTKQQKEWLKQLNQCGQECYIWRPSHYVSGIIEARLARRTQF